MLIFLGICCLFVNSGSGKPFPFNKRKQFTPCEREPSHLILKRNLPDFEFTRIRAISSTLLYVNILCLKCVHFYTKFEKQRNHFFLFYQVQNYNSLSEKNKNFDERIKIVDERTKIGDERKFSKNRR